MLKGESILIYDIETDGLDTSKSKAKWFGAYSYLDNKYYTYDYNDFNKIKVLSKRHKHMVGFNNIEFDDMILENQHKIYFRYNNIIDLLKCAKQKLSLIGLNPKNFKLKTIIDMLKISSVTKGDIDYKIFQKDKWTDEQIKEISEYLGKDIIMTKDLFEWFYTQFKPLSELLNKNDREKMMYIKASPASLSSRIITNLSGIKNEFRTKEEMDGMKSQTFAGGHHVENKEPMYKGNIVSVDFNSAYPHAIIMGNLCSPSSEGWGSNNYYDLKGSYNKEEGKIEQSLNKLLSMKIEASIKKDMIRKKSYKLVLNSFYGTLGNKCFKTFYNPTAAGDCCSMVRTWLKKLAKILSIEGFEIIYGFTDNVMVKIPEQSSKEELIYIVNKFVEEIKKTIPNPKDSFGMEVEKELKFIWFIAKNCYVWVDKDDKVGYKRTVFDKNTPKIIMDVFNKYMTPKIIKELDINFTIKEISEQIRDIIKDNVELASTEFDVKDISTYKSLTSQHYDISKAYGAGKHFLIPNTKNLGVGRSKSNKRKVGVRYCTIKEFKDNGLTVDEIDISKLLEHLKPFYHTKKKNWSSKEHNGILIPNPKIEVVKI